VKMCQDCNTTIFIFAVVKSLHNNNCKYKNGCVASLAHFHTKTAAISLLFDRSSPNSVETLGLPLSTHLLRLKCIVAKIQNDGRHHPQFRKKFVIS